MNKYFQFEKYNTSSRTEIIAGFSSFLATMYIIVVNPAILSQSGMPFNAVLTATVSLAFICTLVMGLYAKNPILVAPGMGMNAFFTFSVVLGMGVKWQTALGAVFWSGIIFILLSVFNIRNHIVNAIPKQLRYAISAGIGLFITLIGFINAKFVISNPATVIGIAPFSPILITFLLGLFLTTILIVKRVKAGIILGIAITTLLSIPIGRIWGDASAVNFGKSTLVNWQGMWASPDFSLFFQADFAGALKFSLLPVMFAFVFTDMFDSLSTFVGVAEAAELHDENGEPRNLKKSLLTDAIATTLAGLFGTSPGTAYIESAVGIEQGGRTGLTAVVAAFLFLPFMFLSPLLSIIPAIATAPALILVGVFMMKPVIKINWSEMDDAIPAFLAMVLIPFSYSITQGIIWGFLSWTIVKTILGKSEEVPVSLWVVDVFILISLFLGH